VEAACTAALAADVIEIRLDYLHTIDVAPFFNSVDKPLLFTNRPAWEGGRFKGSEEVRLGSLLAVVERNASYVDLEVLAPKPSHKRLRTQLEKSKTRLILSWHNFEKTPAYTELADSVSLMQDKGADIGKIVTMAHDHLDVLRVLRLQEEAARLKFPLIAFCMGDPGVISRLATLELGGYMTYCSADGTEGTAPGQLTVKRLGELLALLHNG
jgi:3-dehydroquinate dehydratase-1/3-dehydroquinate dehydratase/shikimate dehydrogenase